MSFFRTRGLVSAALLPACQRARWGPGIGNCSRTRVCLQDGGLHLRGSGALNKIFNRLPLAQYMAGLRIALRGTQFPDQIFVPAIWSSAFIAIGHGQIWSCHPGATLVGTCSTPWHLFAAITVVLRIMSKIKVVGAR
jgi:hypothetical protein